MNEKVVEARERKQQAKAEARGKEAKAKEDAYWAAHENPRGKKDVKKEQEERKREEAAARKAEARRLAAEEEAALAGVGKKKAAPQKVGSAKVTSHQLLLNKEVEKKEEERRAREREDAAKRMVSEDAYASAVVVENVNRQDTGVEARSVEAALDALTVVGGDAAQDRHPEKRAKAAWEAFYAEQLPLLKQDKPGLRLMQYKSMLFDTWQRHPQNPRNQPKA